MIADTLPFPPMRVVTTGWSYNQSRAGMNWSKTVITLTYTRFSLCAMGQESLFSIERANRIWGKRRGHKRFCVLKIEGLDLIEVSSFDTFAEAQAAAEELHLKQVLAARQSTR